MRNYLYIPLLLISVFLAPLSHADDTMQPTNLHSLITQQKTWLNTSRPLVADDLKGRIILLDFWTYCCINCMQIMPDLAYLEEKFGDDLTVIGVHSAKFNNERDSDNIRQAILRNHLQHPVVNDSDFSTWKAFGIQAWPTLLLISPKGIIAQTYSGEGHRADLVRDIERLREQYKGRINTEKLPIALEKDKQPPSILSFPTKLAYTRMFGDEPALLVADSAHNRILVMQLNGTIIETVGNGTAGSADGDFKNAQFHFPQGIAFSYEGDTEDITGIAYIADTGNHLLRKIDFNHGTVSTLAGTGHQGYEHNIHNQPALKASMASPWDLAFYPDNQHLVITQAGLHQLWSYDLATKTISVLAGNGQESLVDGPNPKNALAQTSGVSPVGEGDTLYFVDAETSSLRKLQNGEVTTLIGSGLFDFGYKEGTKTTALMQHPLGLVADDKQVFIADSYNHSIRRYDIATGTLSNFIGQGQRGTKDGDFKTARFNEPNAIIKVGDKLYIADTNNQQIRVADLTSKTVSTLVIIPPPTPVEFSKDLPNMQTSEPVSVTANSALNVTFALQSGWHINPDAPSSLALFRMDATPVAISSFEHATLASRTVTLPTLKAGEYRLQATLYYCADKAGSQCLLKSFDVKVTAQATGKNEIDLPLN